MDILNTVTQVFSILVTVLGAAYWLSTRLERLQGLLEKHTELLRAEMRSLDRDIVELKTESADTRGKVVELGERTARLESRVGCGGTNARTNT